MTPEEFKKIVDAGYQEIAPEFRDKLDNVAIFIAPQPDWEQQRKINLRKGWSLFGLYEGVPLTKRGSNYAMALPDKITIFHDPIFQASRGNPEIMQKIVTETVWHEIAHHFGMNEEEVRKAEAVRRNNNQNHQYEN